MKIKCDIYRFEFIFAYLFECFQNILECCRFFYEHQTKAIKFNLVTFTVGRSYVKVFIYYIILSLFSIIKYFSKIFINFRKVNKSF